MNSGTLFDAMDNILLKNCTLDEALKWLREYDGRGWAAGTTLWVPDHNCVAIYDTRCNFEHFSRHQGTLPTSVDYSPHFPQ